MSVRQDELFGEIYCDAREPGDELPAPVNEEVRSLAGIQPEEVITCRPADLLEPELPKYAEEYKDVAKSEEDVLSLALFPQVAADFIAQRDA